MKRTSIPKDVEAVILVKSRRRCALCFYLDNRLEAISGQIAHIDRDPANNNEDNLAYLCLKHHDDYDTRRSQSKGLQPAELKKAKAELIEMLNDKYTITSRDEATITTPPSAIDGITTDVYNIRLPVYTAFHKFLMHVNSTAQVADDEIGSFIRETHNSLFLYGEEIEQYAREVYHKAIDMRQSQRSMEHPERYNQEQWERIVDREGKCMIWFSDQLQSLKGKFYPFLKLKSQQSL